MSHQTNAIVLFNEQTIRRTWHNEEWWFVVADIVQALTDTANVTDYIKKMRRRDESLAQGWGQIVTPFRYRHLVANKNLIARTPNRCYASFNLSPRLKQNLSSVG